MGFFGQSSAQNYLVEFSIFNILVWLVYVPLKTNQLFVCQQRPPAPFSSKKTQLLCWMFHFFISAVQTFAKHGLGLACNAGKVEVWWEYYCATIHICMCLCISACLYIHEIYKTLKHKLIFGSYDLEQFSNWKVSSSLISVVYSF